MTVRDGSLLGFEGADKVYSEDKGWLNETIWDNGIKYRFCKCTRSGGLSVGFFAFIEENGDASGGTTTSGASYSRAVGVPQVALAQNEFGWLAVAGSGFLGNVAASATADKSVWTTASAGEVDDADGGSDVQIKGGCRTLTGIDANNQATFESVNDMHV